ncbi:hypothetical protein F5Y19DRAFT_484177 [Xylariaceae sp. FL1651]|nr:hypothetical protein F5Y19DRAFT_484177 [Xylariaceae sp. FL1651]
MSSEMSEKDIHEQLLAQEPRTSFDYENGLPRSRPKRWSCAIIAWCILALGWIILLPIALSNRGLKCEELFDDPAHAPIEYESQTFAGLVDPSDFRPHDNPFDAGTEDYWNTLLDVGIIKLSPEEAERLPSKTGHVFGEEPFYAGNLEVYHQLHCLNRLRREYYFPEENEYNATSTDRVGHVKHCFGYLEQTLKCHADVGVMSVKYHSATKGYTPTWNIVKTCRNFNLIQDWARKRKIAHAERGMVLGH